MSPASSRVAPGRGRRTRSDGRAALLFLIPGIAGLLVFVVGPLAWSFWMSLHDWSLLDGAEFVGFDNYLRLVTSDPTFWAVIGNTLVIVFVSVPINILLAVLTALWLGTRVHGRPLFRLIFLLPAITPMVANALVWRFILADDGPINQALAVVGIDGPNWLATGPTALAAIIMVSVWQSFGYNMIIIGAGLDGIDRSLVEAATIDGAGRLARLWHIVLPLITPSLFFATVMTIIGAFQVFVQPYLMTKGGPGQSTNTLVLYLYQAGFVWDDLGYASAIGWVVFALVMVVTGIQFGAQRKLVHYA